MTEVRHEGLGDDDEEFSVPTYERSTQTSSKKIASVTQRNESDVSSRGSQNGYRVCPLSSTAKDSVPLYFLDELVRCKFS